MRTKKIEIEIPEGKKAEWINGVLTLVDESQKDNRPVTERIKTFEDACEELGAEHPLVKLWTDYPDIGLNSQSEDVVAYMKLRIICAALNEGWESQFTKDEWRYYPWFILYTQKEIDAMDEDEREGLLSVNIGRGAVAGFGFLHTFPRSSVAYACFGFRLCQETRGKALYFSKQFVELWAEYLKFNFEVGDRLK